MTVSAQAVLRLALLGLVAGVIQLATISQLPVFGVSADLVPLLTGAVGLLCGATTGSIFGFGLGLFIDTALLQTLGVSSLVLTAVGYGAGRWRELRDPSNSLTPLAVGALSTAAAWLGYAIIQFLLGVDAPVSLLLVRQFLVLVALNSWLALPVHALVRRSLKGCLETPRRTRRAHISARSNRARVRSR